MSAGDSPGCEEIDGVGDLEVVHEGNRIDGKDGGMD